MRELSTTQVIIREAQSRGIAAVCFPDADENVYELSYNGRSEYIYYSNSDHFGSVIYKIFGNKKLTTELLRQGGFPVPADRIVSNIEEAKEFLAEYKKIVVKPVSNTGGIGITVGVTEETQLEQALKTAIEYNKSNNAQEKAVCQEYVEGRDFRLLVINREHVFVAERIPAHVVGNGRSTVKELIEESNNAIAEAYHIHLKEEAESLLKEQCVEADTVLEEGQAVRLARVANAHAGGTVCDMTDMVGEDIKEQARAVAKYFRVPVVGIDCLSNDITKSIGYLIELNSTPDITIHHSPDRGESRNVAATIVDMLFPETV